MIRCLYSHLSCWINHILILNSENTFFKQKKSSLESNDQCGNWAKELWLHWKKGSWFLKEWLGCSDVTDCRRQMQVSVGIRLPFITELGTLGRALETPIGSMGVYEQQEDEVEKNETWPANAHNTHQKQHWHEDLKIKASLLRFDTAFCLCSHETQTTCFICTQPRPAALRLCLAACLNSPAVVLLLDCVCVSPPAIFFLISLCVHTQQVHVATVNFLLHLLRPATNLLLFFFFFLFSMHLRAWCRGSVHFFDVCRVNDDKMWFQPVLWPWRNTASLTRVSVLLSFCSSREILKQQHMSRGHLGGFIYLILRPKNILGFAFCVLLFIFVSWHHVLLPLLPRSLWKRILLSAGLEKKKRKKVKLFYETSWWT